MSPRQRNREWSTVSIRIILSVNFKGKRWTNLLIGSEAKRGDNQPFHRMCHTAGMAGQRTHASHLASISIISDVVVVLVAVSDVVEDCIKRVTPAR